MVQVSHTTRSASRQHGKEAPSGAACEGGGLNGRAPFLPAQPETQPAPRHPSRGNPRLCFIAAEAQLVPPDLRRDANIRVTWKPLSPSLSFTNLFTRPPFIHSPLSQAIPTFPLSLPLSSIFLLLLSSRPFHCHSSLLYSSHHLLSIQVFTVAAP